MALENLTDEELEALDEVLDREDRSYSSPVLDEAIDKAPKLPALTLYKYYEADSRFEDEGGYLTNPGYLIAGTKPLPIKDGVSVFQIEVPAGSLNGIEVGDGTYLLKKDLTVGYFPQVYKSGFNLATIREAFGKTGQVLTASAPAKIVFGGTPIPSKDDFCECGQVNENFATMANIKLYCNGVHEFHLPGQHDQSSHSGGRGGRSSGGALRAENPQGNQAPGQGQNRRQPAPRRPSGGGRKPSTRGDRIAKVARNIVAVLAVATAAITIYNFVEKQRDRKADAPVREQRRENAKRWLDENKPKLTKEDQAVLDWLQSKPVATQYK